MSKYTDQEIEFIIKQKENLGKTYREIAIEFNELFQPLMKKTPKAIENTYNRYKDIDFSSAVFVKNLKDVNSAKEKAKNTSKENSLLLSYIQTQEDLVDQIDKLIESKNFKKIKIPKFKPDKKKMNMAMEALLSDLHFGLKTKTYDLNVLRSRMQQYTSVYMREYDMKKKHYNVNLHNILLNGDLIQSATMHKDSGKGCHLTNAEQISEAIDGIFEDIILPIAGLGSNVRIIGMSGNHDRERPERFTVDPGTSYYTYTIFRSLKKLIEVKGLTNIEFIIPDEGFYIYDMFDRHFLVEHGDALKKGTTEAMETLLMKRSAQRGLLLHGIRVGHFHNDLCASLGRYIINGSTVSDDHFGNMLGYKSRPTQFINFYVDTKKRETSYYYSFPVNLE